MLIQKSGHYMIRGNTPMGESYHHVYLSAGYDTDSCPQMGEVVAGPFDTAEEAHIGHRKNLPTEHPMYIA